ncbi:MAG: hypothetical protein IKS20_04760 [Victivallales bacterium]|nr:hypothetical protein [Victivallales bacterium]
MEQYDWIFLCCAIVVLAFGIALYILYILKSQKAKERETEKAQMLSLMKLKREEREKREKEEFQKYLASLPLEEKKRVLKERLEKSEARFEAIKRSLQALEMQRCSKEAAEEEAARRSDANTQKALMFMLGAAWNELSNDSRRKEQSEHTQQRRSHHLDFDEVEDDDYY